MNPQADFPKIEQLEIIAEIGRGAHARVFEAVQIRLARRVAVKVLLKANLLPVDYERFAQEAKLNAQLDHPNIAKFYGSGLTKAGEPYILMELIEGATLSEFLSENSPLSFEAIRNIFLPLLSALQFAHDKGLVHRDIKPGNIMLRKNEGEALSVKLLDFGIAKLYTETDIALTKPGVIVGSPAYMSPEQFKAQKLDASSDLYACTCILYEAISNSPPFVCENIMEIMQAKASGIATSSSELARTYGIPRELAELILRGLSPNPSERPASASEFSLQLDAILKDLPPEGRPERGAKPARRTKMILSIIAVLAVLLSAAVSVLFLSKSRPAKPNPIDDQTADDITFESLRRKALSLEKCGRFEDALRLREREISKLQRHRINATTARQQAIYDAVEAARAEEGDRLKALAGKGIKLVDGGLLEASKL